MARVGLFLLGPTGLALLAVLTIAINWRDIKTTVKAFVQKVKDYNQAILDATGISALIDLFSTGTEDVDDFTAMPSEIKVSAISTDGSILVDQRDDNVFGSDEVAERLPC